MSAFEGCIWLTSLELPSSLDSIGDEAFYRCSQLRTVTCLGTEPARIGYSVFYKKDPYTIPVRTFNVPCGSLNAYKEAWADYSSLMKDDCGTFTITFVNWDGEELYSHQWKELETPALPSYIVPERPADDEFTYTFIGWTPEIVPVKEDATYTATYEATEKSQGIEDVVSKQATSHKVMSDGQLLILRGDKTYTVTGQEIK